MVVVVVVPVVVVTTTIIIIISGGGGYDSDDDNTMIHSIKKSVRIFISSKCMSSWLSLSNRHPCQAAIMLLLYCVQKVNLMYITCYQDIPYHPELQSYIKY